MFLNRPSRSPKANASAFVLSTHGFLTMLIKFVTGDLVLLGRITE